MAYPERIDSGVTPLDLTVAGGLHFETPDLKRFPCLGLAFDALRAGGVAPAVLNAANEVAVEAFLTGGARFTDIARVVEGVLGQPHEGSAESLDGVLAADAGARAAAQQLVASLAR
jgi:1-deoxy-D-xylulose-5-phosphate reductoisomerase